MNKVYKATCTIQVDNMEIWSNYVRNANVLERLPNGDAFKVVSIEYHTARTEKELRGLLESSFVGHLLHSKIEYVRKAHVQDSGFCNLYPSFSRLKVLEDKNGKFYVKDTKEKTKSEKFRCRIKAVNHLLEYESKLI